MNVNNVRSQIIDGVEINTHFDKGPFFIDGVDTICSLFLQRCKQLQKKVVHREKELGIWKSYTWNDFYHNVRLISLGLNKLGFTRGDKASILERVDLRRFCRAVFRWSVYRRLYN